MSGQPATYPLPPPGYSPDVPSPSAHKSGYGTQGGVSEVNEPLLGEASSSAAGAAAGARRGRFWGGEEGAWQGDHSEGDIPDDFKYSTSVSSCTADIKNAFIRKVYSILFIQILGTVVVGGIMSKEEISQWVLQNTWLIWTSMIGALVSIFALYFKAHSHPTNVILLGVFTLLESIAVGGAISGFNQTIVLKALVITLFVFGGLTLFTFQSKYDFSSLGTYLYGGLLVFIFTGLAALFFPWSKTIDAVYAGAGALIFSGYILFDTWMLMNRLTPDDWVIACVSLYLDVLNLFLNILRLLSDLQRD
jgi:FtsH-binding integral membrane protein